MTPTPHKVQAPPSSQSDTLGKNDQENIHFATVPLRIRPTPPDRIGLDKLSFLGYTWILRVKVPFFVCMWWLNDVVTCF